MDLPLVGGFPVTTIISAVIVFMFVSSFLIDHFSAHRSARLSKAALGTLILGTIGAGFILHFVGYLGHSIQAPIGILIGAGCIIYAALKAPRRRWALFHSKRFWVFAAALVLAVFGAHVLFALDAGAWDTAGASASAFWAGTVRIGTLAGLGLGMLLAAALVVLFLFGTKPGRALLRSRAFYGLLAIGIVIAVLRFTDAGA